MTGLSDDCGCWKIIAMRSPRTSRSSASGSVQQVAAVEDDLARLDAPGRRDEPQDRQRRDGLAAAGLADEPERPRRADLKSTPVTARTTPSRV